MDMPLLERTLSREGDESSDFRHTDGSKIATFLTLDFWVCLGFFLPHTQELTPHYDTHISQALINLITRRDAPWNQDMGPITVWIDHIEAHRREAESIRPRPNPATSKRRPKKRRRKPRRRKK
jgi:hypothetical protein